MLAKRDKPEHMQTLADHALPEIDLVVCNLYPFEQTVAKPGVTEAEAIENIDIGGPCMVRAAAKNFNAVTIVVEPINYDVVLTFMETSSGEVPLHIRKHLAHQAFMRIREYDEAISDYFLHSFPDSEPPESRKYLEPTFERTQKLRYGENPHQKAAFYKEPGIARPCVATAEQLHGKELSYNNILDLDSALNLRARVRRAGVRGRQAQQPVRRRGRRRSSRTPSTRAWDGDPLSAFGGIIAFNRPVDADTASALMDPKAKRFIECVIAPDYEPHALDALKKWKENVRLLKTGDLTGGPQGLDYRRVDGGLLVQTRDVGADNPDTWKVATKRKPTEAEAAALHFAWFVCKHVKSNAIVLAKDTHVVGVGAGQMSRVVSVEIAVKKAGERSKGRVLASDAFFPFPDNVHAAAAAGVTAIIQPGGSVKDKDSVAACDEHGIAMLFTGVRHFRH